MPNQYTYSWVTDPPVELIEDPIWAEVAAVQLLQNVKDYSLGLTMDWDRRINSTNTMAESVRKDRGNELNWVYKLEGQAIGIVCVIDCKPTYIAKLVTHPGSQNAGGILIERVVQHSQEAGHGGVVELLALTDESEEAYMALGYRKVEHHMRLDPADCQGVWEKVGQRWRLTRYAKQRYLTTTGQTVPVSNNNNVNNNSIQGTPPAPHKGPKPPVPRSDKPKQLSRRH